MTREVEWQPAIVIPNNGIELDFRAASSSTFGLRFPFVRIWLSCMSKSCRASKAWFVCAEFRIKRIAVGSLWKRARENIKLNYFFNSLWKQRNWISTWLIHARAFRISDVRMFFLSSEKRGEIHQTNFSLAMQKRSRVGANEKIEDPRAANFWWISKIRFVNLKQCKEARRDFAFASPNRVNRLPLSRYSHKIAKSGTCRWLLAFFVCSHRESRAAITIKLKEYLRQSSLDLVSLAKLMTIALYCPYAALKRKWRALQGQKSPFYGRSNESSST